MWGLNRGITSYSLCVLAVLLVWGCGDDDDNNDDNKDSLSSELNVEEFADILAGHVELCKQEDAAAKIDPAYVQAVSSAKDDLIFILEQSLKADALIYSPEKYSDCTDTLKNADTCLLSNLRSGFSNIAGCDEMLVGTLDEGDSCVSFGCKEGLECIPDSSGACGNGECATPEEDADDSNLFKGLKPEIVKENEQCDSWMADDPVKFCENGFTKLYCLVEPDEETGVCTKRAEIGENCASDSPCNELEAYCDYEVGTCIAKNELGDKCSSAAECVVGLICHTGVCAEPCTEASLEKEPPSNALCSEGDVTPASEKFESDGCSGPSIPVISWYKELFGEKYLAGNLLPPCVYHDSCYLTCGCSKLDCDVIFAARMHHWCNAWYHESWNFTARGACHAVVPAFFYAVQSPWGFQAYWHDQNDLAICQGSSYNVYLQATNGQYLSATNDGGSGFEANAPAQDVWEEITIIKPGAGVLESGDVVALETSSGYYVCAEHEGGGDVVADHNEIGTWEMFSILKATGSGEINDGDYVVFKTSDGAHYFQAKNGGGGDLCAEATAVGGVPSWETFTIIFRD